MLKNRRRKDILRLKRQLGALQEQTMELISRGYREDMLEPENFAYHLAISDITPSIEQARLDFSILSSRAGTILQRLL